MVAKQSGITKKRGSLKYVFREKNEKKQFNRREDYLRSIIFLLLLWGVFFGVGIYYVIF